MKLFKRKPKHVPIGQEALDAYSDYYALADRGLELYKAKVLSKNEARAMSGRPPVKNGRAFFREAEAADINAKRWHQDHEDPRSRSQRRNHSKPLSIPEFRTRKVRRDIFAPLPVEEVTA